LTETQIAALFDPPTDQRELVGVIARFVQNRTLSRKPSEIRALMQFGWVNGRFDPLGDFYATLVAAGTAVIAVLRTGNLSGLVLALPRPWGDSDNIVFVVEWLYVGAFRIAELLSLIVMVRYAVGVMIALCRAVFHLIGEHLQRPQVHTQTPHGPPPDDWETI
jgi:hypothetical protein